MLDTKKGMQTGIYSSIEQYNLQNIKYKLFVKLSTISSEGFCKSTYFDSLTLSRHTLMTYTKLLNLYNFYLLELLTDYLTGICKPQIMKTHHHHLNGKALVLHDKSGQVYIGETKRMLRTRLRDHRGYITNGVVPILTCLVILWQTFQLKSKNSKKKNNSTEWSATNTSLANLTLSTKEQKDRD